MFHVGLFSSFIPYLVIAAIYFCGLASYSIDLVNTHISNDQEETYLHNDNNAELAVKYVTSTHSNTVSINKLEYLNFNFHNTRGDKVLWDIFKTGKELQAHSYALFSRPPPYLS